MNSALKNTVRSMLAATVIFAVPTAYAASSIDEFRAAVAKMDDTVPSDQASEDLGWIKQLGSCPTAIVLSHVCRGRLSDMGFVPRATSSVKIGSVRQSFAIEVWTGALGNAQCFATSDWCEVLAKPDLVDFLGRYAPRIDLVTVGDVQTLTREGWTLVGQSNDFGGSHAIPIGVMFRNDQTMICLHEKCVIGVQVAGK